ncbi:MAG: methylated-DNA--[protein]-cysteine S-methyltransferase [Oscillospiraceae bacterium]|nr:methylated-DNA--[protein]-cysteine S-methyltransferase [Oscillospiraceae bacterium]
MYLYKSPIGDLFIKTDSEALVYLGFADDDTPNRNAALTERVVSQLDEYFAGKRREFDIPIKLYGTMFQMAVWAGLMQIPYGKTVSYAQLAAMIGKPKAARAVGGANHVNLVSIIVPCHRVIGANGKLVGYGGGLDKKEFLLELENS